ncbi:MAG TPA: DUF2760 domain-containing protein [Pyrinomonadaceae bacterium]|nr:DUF2760 domain-containing protein [Pyrinomonadaceae bacterium]
MIGFGKRISYAARCFFSILSRGEVPEDIAPDVVRGPSSPAPSQTPEAAAPPPAKQNEAHHAEDSADRAVQILALLQRDGRLIDFFNEDITPYQDAQVGAAVRELHANCRKALDRYVRLEPILVGEEDGPVTVDEGFDPASVKLVGNVKGRPPLRGVLRHRGWRVTEINLPSLSPQGEGRAVVAQAEVEIQ